MLDVITSGLLVNIVLIVKVTDKKQVETLEFANAMQALMTIIKAQIANLVLSFVHNVQVIRIVSHVILN